jgi:hypothetical protein
MFISITEIAEITAGEPELTVAMNEDRQVDIVRHSQPGEHGTNVST